MKCWLVCERCGKQQAFDDLVGACACGGPFFVHYDMDQVKWSLSQTSFQNGPNSLWRYLPLLPIQDPQKTISLGEGMTPIVRLRQLEALSGISRLWIKREEQNPTGSFKARGFTVAVSLLHERGYKKVAVPSNGNAASALAAYASRAGLCSYVFLPKDCPGMIVEECIYYGANVYLVDGLIHHASQIVAEGMKEQGWFHIGTAKEPGRVEGKKTMGFELAEQLANELPTMIVYPTGGGSGILGIWKALKELRQLGLYDEDFPKIVSVQETGCQPIVEAWEKHSTTLLPVVKEHVASSPTGMRVPKPPAGNEVLKAIRESGGCAIAVSQEEIRKAQMTLGHQGISSSPEGAATYAGFLKARESGYASEKDRVLLFNTSHAQKYLPWKSSKHVPLISNYQDFLKWEKNEIQ